MKRNTGKSLSPDWADKLPIQSTPDYLPDFVVWEEEFFDQIDTYGTNFSSTSTIGEETESDEDAQN